jgi:4-amino-4-deoxy-L-arabinose transferase-like glycosyltransferase
MRFIRKNKEALAISLLIILYFSTRLYNILALPIFTDEAIYIRWSQIALNDAAWRFISLTDGKQPLFIWLAMSLMRFIQDPLLAGRMVSVLAGAGSALAIFLITREIFKNQITAFLACFIYILFPFALVYDRLALYDSLTAMFILWALYFEIVLVRLLRLDLAIILGMIIGAGMLTKSSAQFTLILLPFSLLLFDFKNKKIKHRLFLWALYAGLSAILANLIYLILRLSPFFYIIDQKNHVFIYTFGEWIKNPALSLLNNLSAFESWIIEYTTIPFIALAIAVFFIPSKFTKEKIYLYFWFLIPLISTAFFGRLVYPRFLLFMVLPLIILVAHSLTFFINKAKNIKVKIIIITLFISMFVLNDFFIINDFKNARIPSADKEQFLTGWPSGVGVKETVKFLTDEAKDKKIFIGTQGTFGLMPYALEIYLSKNPNIQIKGYWPIGDKPPKDVLSKARAIPVYFVFYQECPNCKQTGSAPESWPVTEIFKIEKNDKGNFYTLYKINPQ